MRRLILFFITSALAFLLSPPAQGQEAGALTGVVEDPSGAPIPGAHVKLTQKATAEVFKTTSDETGHFEFRNLPEGKYVLSAQAQGVEPIEMVVSIGARPAAPMRIRMEIAELKEEVTVTASPLSTPSAQNNTDAIDIGQDFLLSLPIKYYQLLAVPSMFTDDAAIGSGSIKPQVVVDGVPTDALDMPVLGIRRFSVNKNPYAAEFGRPGKGRIDVTTKHHVHQQFHGGLTTLVQNYVFDARDAFADVRAPEHRSLSEAELEGPLSRNVTFLLAARYDNHNEADVVEARTLKGPLVENVILPERNTFLYGRLNFRNTAAGNLSVAYKFKNISLRNQYAGGFVLPEHALDSFDHENDVRFFDTKIWPNFINELRIGVRKRRESFDDVSHSPDIIVLGNFFGGGAQVSRVERDTTADVEDIASRSFGKHTLRFGGGTMPRYLSYVNLTNFGGTFTFAGQDPLSDFAANRPSRYTVNVGNPKVSFNQYESYSFVQDEMRLRRNLSMVAGLRYEWQSNVSYRKKFAPRLALAYSPGGGHTVLRAGFGVFYETQPASLEEDNLLYDGVRIREIDVVNPSFPTPFAGGVVPTTAIPSVLRIAPNMRFPYLMQASLTFERQLGKGQNYLSLDYTTRRGVRLYRLRNLNAPLPGATTPPNPNFVNFDQYESSATSRGNTLAVTFRSRAQKRLNFLAQYKLSKTLNDTGGISLSALPANNYDLRPEWGPANFDRRHQFNFLGTYSTFWRLQFGAVVNLHTGLPYDITTGLDDYHDGQFNARPPGVTRNTGRDRGLANLDLRCSRSFLLGKSKGEQRRLEVGVDAFNALNHVNYLGSVGIISSSFFGQPNAANPGRQVQLTLRFSF